MVPNNNNGILLTVRKLAVCCHFNCYHQHAEYNIY